MTRTALVVPFLALATGLLGCAAAHEAREVGSGIYDLTVHGDVDACSPTRATGAMGEVGIVVEADVLNVAVPDGVAEHLARVSLARADGFSTEVHVDVEGCPGAQLHRVWSVLDSSDDRFEVGFSQSWTGITGCDAARLTMPAAPSADCTAEQVLEYTLTTPCASPCEVRIVAGAPACACD